MFIGFNGINYLVLNKIKLIDLLSDTVNMLLKVDVSHKRL